MDTVTLQGKEYTKASVLAIKFRYTTDYLGQLCRGKKVDARLVGRAWYINLDSLLDHRANRHQASVPAEISTKKEINNYLSRVDVEPVLKHKTLRILKNKSGVFADSPVSYEFDEQALIPKVTSRSVSAWLPILPAEAERLPVKSSMSSSISSFKPTALPEVSLSGTLLVVDSSDITEETIAAEPEIETVIMPAIEPVRQQNIARTVMVRPKRKVSRVTKPEPTPAPSVASLKTPIVPPLASPAGTTASARLPQVVRFAPTVVQGQPISSPQSFFGRVGFSLGSLILALVVSLVIFSLNVEVFVTSTTYESSLHFTLTNLSYMIDQLRD